MIKPKLAGDRGLALVLIGLIGLALLWRLELGSGVRPQGRTELEALPHVPSDVPAHALERKLRSDYRTFHERLSGFAGRESKAERVFVFPESPLSNDDAVAVAAENH